MLMNGAGMVVPPFENMTKEFVFSELFPYTLHDIVNLPRSKLTFSARMVRKNVHQCYSHILPRFNELHMRKPRSAKRVLYLMGLTSPDHVPTNVKAHPIPYGAILMQFSSDFVQDHPSLTDGIFYPMPIFLLTIGLVDVHLNLENDSYSLALLSSSCSIGWVPGYFL